LNGQDCRLGLSTDRYQCLISYMAYIVSFYGSFVRGYLSRKSLETTRSIHKAKRFRSYIDAKLSANDFRFKMREDHGVYVSFNIKKHFFN